MVWKTYTIKRVEGIIEDTDGVKLSFLDGSSAVLRNDETGAMSMLPYLRRQGGCHSLVGVHLNAQNEIADIGAVDRNLVLGVRDKGSSTPEADVWFGGMDGSMSLLKTHPQFRELFADLTAAAASKQPVWYITKGGCVLDVLVPSPEEDTALSGT
jgi:hypothetical protein